MVQTRASYNGETFQEIRDILAKEKKIPAHVANRLILAALADLRDQQYKQGQRIEEVEKNSIILWAKRNKAVAVLLASLIAVAPLEALRNIVKTLAEALR